MYQTVRYTANKLLLLDILDDKISLCESRLFLACVHTSENHVYIEQIIPWDPLTTAIYIRYRLHETEG